MVTERQMDTQTDTMIARYRLTERRMETDAQLDRLKKWTEMQRHNMTERQTDEQTEKQSDRKTDR